MAYKKFALYFKRFDQIVYEIIANLFTHSFLSVSFTHLNSSNSLPSRLPHGIYFFNLKGNPLVKLYSNY